MTVCVNFHCSIKTICKICSGTNNDLPDHNDIKKKDKSRIRTVMETFKQTFDKDRYIIHMNR